MSELLDSAQHALALVGEDPRRALVEADAIVAAIPRPRDADEVRGVAIAHRAAGLALRTTGEPTLAAARLRRGLRLAERFGQAQTAAEIRMSESFVLLELGRLRAALETVDHALGVLTGVEAAHARTNRALILHRSGRIREALAEYDAALVILQRAGDGHAECLLRTNRAHLYAELGDTAAAVTDQEWARDYDVAHGLTLDAADDLWNLGSILGMAGDIPTALGLFDRAEAEWGDAERPQRWIGRAELLLDAGLVDEAIVHARTAVDQLATRGWHYLEAEARLQLALALLSGPSPDPSAAGIEADHARALLARQNRPVWEALARYARAKARLLETPAAAEIDDAVHVASVLRDAGREAHAADLRLTAALAADRRGDLRRTRTLLGPLAAQESSRSLDVRSRASYARALLALAADDRRTATAALRRAWAALDTRRSLLGATELRAAAAEHARAVVDTATQICLDAGSARDVFAWTERGRAASLRLPPSSSHDPDLSRALTRLRWAAQLDDQAVRDNSVDRVAREARSRSESDIVRLTRTRGSTGGTERPASAADVRALVEDDAFVQYLVHDGRVWAVAVTSRRSTLTRLADVALVRERARACTFATRRLLSGSSARASHQPLLASARAAAADLDALLVLPLGDDVLSRGAVVCPDPVLVDVLWPMLPSSHGREVRVAPSATLWCRARVVPRDVAAPVVVAAGPGLPGADAEAALVSAHHPRATHLAGPDATVEAVLAALPSAGLAHVAAHGILRRDNPLFSALALADGPLTGYDLESLHSVPRDVVLSACSSGAAHQVGPGETLGLAWTLLGLGCASVLAPVLPVPDGHTRDLMSAVHRRIADGADPASALSRAREDVHDDEIGRLVAETFVAVGA